MKKCFYFIVLASIIPILFCYFYFDINTNVRLASLFSLVSFSEFFIFLGVSSLFLMIKKPNRISFICFFIFSLFYFTLSFVQLFSLIVYETNIPEIAFHNLNNIAHILSWNLFLTICCFSLYFILLLVIFSLVKKEVAFISRKKLVYFALFFIIVGIVNIIIFGRASKISNNEKIRSPIVGLIHTYKRALLSASIEKIEDVIIDNIESKFWIKNTVYQSNIVFNDDNYRPNIIILIPDGLSTRLITGYQKNNQDYQKIFNKFGELTPNIDKIIEKSLMIDNYYNHTAATYSGLPGMFSSSYPLGGMSYDEINRMKTGKRKKAVLSSLFDILHLNNYDSYFVTTDGEETLIPYVFREILHVKNIYSPTNFDRIHKSHQNYSRLTDNDIFTAIKNIFEKTNNQEPKIVAAYFIGTHLNIEPRDFGGIGYKDNSNMFLNAMHNFDNEFGLFIDWFEKSKFAQNTIIIVSTDHAHFPDREYKKLLKENTELAKGFEPVFCDKIPFIVYNAKNLPLYFDAKSQTSLSFTPTILHFLGYKNYRNAFMAGSLWDIDTNEYHLYSEGIQKTFCIKDEKILNFNDCENEIQVQNKFLKIKQYQKLELDGLLFDENYKIE